MVIGKNVSNIETPALVIDFDKLNYNINKMADYFKKINCCLRPHFKTHKSPLIAHKQMKAGAVGITCAKLGETEVLAKSGIKSILIANQIVEKSKIFRLAGLSRYCDIIVAVDNMENIDMISNVASKFSTSIGIVIEVDVGHGRCGTREKEIALQLATRIKQSKGLVLRGIMGYEGHCVFIGEKGKRISETQKSMNIIKNYKNFLESRGFDIEIVSGGGTGTYQISSKFSAITEVEAGSYVFMDTRYNMVEGMEFKNSLSLLSTVTSKPCSGIAVCDAGMKSITHENGVPEIIEPAGLKLLKLSEEHGKIQTGVEDNLKVGEKIRILPSHVCTTVNLHDKYYVTSKDLIIDIWEIAARGKFV